MLGVPLRPKTKFVIKFDAFLTHKIICQYANCKTTVGTSVSEHGWVANTLESPPDPINS